MMSSIRRSSTIRAWLAVVAIALTATVFTPTTAQADAGSFSGSLPNGTTWIAEVPADWNGTMLLHSHGYLPSFVPFPNPTPTIGSIPAGQELLDLGYAVVASSYADKGWALPTAPQDQLDSLDAAIAAIGTAPDSVLTYGTSMGGLVTAQLAESAGDVIDGAMPTCGIVAGGVDLLNYQFDATHAINELLGDGTIPIANYGSQGEAFAATGELVGAVNAAVASGSPEAEARVALVAAFMQLEPEDLIGILNFVIPGRYDLIVAAGGGDTVWNEGVDYWKLFSKSPDRASVAESYRKAGLSLKDDLDTLTDTADVAYSDQAAAVATLQSHSQPTGELQMPVLTMHTAYDQLVPSNLEDEYADDVRSQGDGSLLRQVYVDRPGHCTFNSAEIVAGITVLAERVDTGRWPSASASVKQLNNLASSFGLDDPAFIKFKPGEFIADRSDDLDS